MPRIFDFGGREVERSLTVAGLRALKGAGRQAAQVTAETADEAAAAEAAGIEMVVCRAGNVATRARGLAARFRYRGARLRRGGHRPTRFCAPRSRQSPAALTPC